MPHRIAWPLPETAHTAAPLQKISGNTSREGCLPPGLWCGLLVWLILPTAHPAMADVVRLNSGGEIRGEVLNRQVFREQHSEATVEVRTLSGAVISVDHDAVRFVTQRPLEVEQYETRAKLVEHTVEARWELAEWCRVNRLEEQRNEQLEQIVILDPQHEKAHYGLGHTRNGDDWVDRDELMQEQGYVKYKGRYITPQELEIITKSEQQREAEQEWYRTIRRLRSWIKGRSPKRSQMALKELKEIRHPDAVWGLAKNFSDEENTQLRGLYITVLGQIDGPGTVGPLVRQSLEDVDYEVRYAALNEITGERIEPALPLYVDGLRHRDNTIVRRSAAAIGRFGDERVVPDLISALVTTHRYRILVPDRSATTSFRADASGFGNPGEVVIPPEVDGMIRSGQLPYGAIVNQVTPPTARKMRKVTIKYDHQNAEALEALQKITGQSHGYSERDWRVWWAASSSGALKPAGSS